MDSGFRVARFSFWFTHYVRLLLLIFFGMLIFMMGIDLSGLIVLIVVLSMIGTGIFYLIRPLISRIFPSWSAGAVATTSRAVAFIVSPALLTLIVYIIIYDELYPDYVLLEQERYAVMEEELNRELKVGMAKTEVLEHFWLTDTTQSSYQLDLSPADAKEKFMLQLEFENGKLKSFERME